MEKRAFSQTYFNHFFCMASYQPLMCYQVIDYVYQEVSWLQHNFWLTNLVIDCGISVVNYTITSFICENLDIIIKGRYCSLAFRVKVCYSRSKLGLSIQYITHPTCGLKLLKFVCIKDLFYATKSKGAQTARVREIHGGGCACMAGEKYIGPRK